jgi:hypothetical protein
MLRTVNFIAKIHKKLTFVKKNQFVFNKTIQLKIILVFFNLLKKSTQQKNLTYYIRQHKKDKSLNYLK